MSSEGHEKIRGHGRSGIEGSKEGPCLSLHTILLLLLLLLPFFVVIPFPYISSRLSLALSFLVPTFLHLPSLSSSIHSSHSLHSSSSLLLHYPDSNYLPLHLLHLFFFHLLFLPLLFLLLSFLLFHLHLIHTPSSFPSLPPTSSSFISPRPFPIIS